VLARVGKAGLEPAVCTKTVTADKSTKTSDVCAAGIVMIDVTCVARVRPVMNPWVGTRKAGVPRRWHCKVNGSRPSSSGKPNSTVVPADRWTDATAAKRCTCATTSVSTTARRVGVRVSAQDTTATADGFLHMYCLYSHAPKAGSDLGPCSI
jgi:hypothetical protein